jgi:outer membrane lipoprotein SlyB
MKGHFDIGRWGALAVTLLAPSLLGLTGCGPNYSPNTYDQRAVQQANKVEQGVIVGVRQIDIASPGTTGTIAGAAAGGIAGSQAQEGSVAALTALGGSIVGGILGNTIEKKLNDTFGYEYVVRKGNGDMVSVTQKDEQPLVLGLHVLVIAGPQARIVADYTVPVETNKQPTAANADPSSVAKPSPPPPATEIPSAPRPTAVITLPSLPDAPPPVTSPELRPAEPPPADVKPIEIAPLAPPPAALLQAVPAEPPADARTE